MNTLKMLVLVLVALLATGDASAEGTDCSALGNPPKGLQEDRELARTLYQQGEKLYAADQFKEAARIFIASYHAAPEGSKPKLMFNVGQALMRAGDLENAVAFFRCYLASNPTGTSTAELARIALLEMATTKPAEPAPAAAPIDKEWENKPQPAPQAAPLTPHYRTWDEVAEEPTHPRRVWTWVAAGVTGAALATGIGFGISSERKFEELEDAGCANTSAGCPRDEVQAIERNQLIANIAFGVAAVGTISTGVLWFWEGRDATVSMKVNPNGASAMIRW